MCQTIRTKSVSGGGCATVERLQLKMFPSTGGCLVTAKGELDRASRDEMVAALTSGLHRHMLVDFAALTFMDCAGYGALVAGRLRLENSERTLTVFGFTGQPKRFLAVLDGLELGGHRPHEVRREAVAIVDAS